MLFRSQHYDVFRKAFTSDNGEQVLLPVPGNTSQYRFAIARNQTWDMGRMKIVAILNDQSNSNVLQANSYKNPTATGIISTPDNEIEVEVYPNPVNQFLKVKTAQTLPTEISIFDLTGKLQHRVISQDGKEELNLASFQAGVYLLEIQTEEGFYTRTIFKQ